MEPIQETPIDDILVELSKQAELDKIMESLADDNLTSSIEQPDIQRVNVSDAPINQPRHSPGQVDLQTEQPAEV
jgi:hypothetical protein